MRADTTLMLGDFAFARFEIPEQITFGGEQKLAVHELIGRKRRIIDSLGPADTALTWQGKFIGQNASSRARYLDSLRVAGKPLTLTWAEFAYQVVIRSYKVDYQRAYQLPYQIECEVLEDSTQAITEVASPGVDRLIAEDMAEAEKLASGIGDGPLSALLGGLNQAIRTVGSVASAVSSTLNSVLQPLADVRARLSILLTQVNAVVRNASTLGGLLPNNSMAQRANRLMTHANAMTQLPRLIQLDRVLGRISANLTVTSSSARQVSVAGGNLYALAAQEYGDATAWQTIAQANGLTDPVIHGIQTLTIPPYDKTTRSNA